MAAAAGKFDSMFRAQVRRTPGIHVVAVAALDPQRASECPPASAGSRSSTWRVLGTTWKLWRMSARRETT